MLFELCEDFFVQYWYGVDCVYYCCIGYCGWCQVDCFDLCGYCDVVCEFVI